jgi:hypothetical protein
MFTHGLLTVAKHHDLFACKAIDFQDGVWHSQQSGMAAVVMSKGIEPSSNAWEAAVPSLHCTRMSDNLRSFPKPWQSSQAPGLLKDEMGLLGLACLFRADLIFCKPPASTILRSHEFSAKPNPAK